MEMGLESKSCGPTLGECVGIHSNPHEFGIFHVKGNTLGPDVIQAFFEAQKNRLAGFGCVNIKCTTLNV